MGEIIFYTFSRSRDLDHVTLILYEKKLKI